MEVATTVVRNMFIAGGISWYYVGNAFFSEATFLNERPRKRMATLETHMKD